MEITNVRIHKVENHKSFIGYADIIFDDCFIVKGFRVVKSREGNYKVIAPYRKPTKKDQENNVRVQEFHPINSEMRVKIENAVASALVD